jgi:hypothetical protein
MNRSPRHPVSIASCAKWTPQSRKVCFCFVCDENANLLHTADKQRTFTLSRLHAHCKGASHTRKEQLKRDFKNNAIDGKFTCAECEQTLYSAAAYISHVEKKHRGRMWETEAPPKKKVASRHSDDDDISDAYDDDDESNDDSDAGATAVTGRTTRSMTRSMTSAKAKGKARAE